MSVYSHESFKSAFVNSKRKDKYEFIDHKIKQLQIESNLLREKYELDIELKNEQISILNVELIKRDELINQLRNYISNNCI